MGASMKKLLFLAMALALVFVLWRKPEVRPTAQESTLAAEQVRSVAAAPAPAAGETEAVQAAATEAAPTGAAGEALPAVAPAKLFPHARVVAQVEVAGERPGEVRVIKTVETNRKERYIRVEETYTGGAINAAGLVRESAMVANQLLTQRPEAMAEESFVRILSETGAAEIKKIGDAFLVTFHAEPENPRALDAYIARIKAALGSAVVEPNYIRHLL
jgi:hypothetical protein